MGDKFCIYVGCSSSPNVRLKYLLNWSAKKWTWLHNTFHAFVWSNVSTKYIMKSTGCLKIWCIKLTTHAWALPIIKFFLLWVAVRNLVVSTNYHKRTQLNWSLWRIMAYLEVKQMLKKTVCYHSWIVKYLQFLAINSMNMANSKE